jgi:hypothetical protein
VADSPPTAGKYAIEIWTDSSGTNNKKLVRAEQVNGQWERKMNGNLIEQYDLKSHLNDSQSALTEFGSPTPIAVGYIVDQNNGGSSDSSGNSSGTTNGLPVYDLTITQVSSIVSSIELGGSNPPTAGKYAIEIWTDSSGTHNKKLVRAEQVNGQWERKMNGNLIEQYDLKSYLNDSQSALTEFGSPTPIAVGYIVDQNNGGSSDSSGNSSGTTNGLPVYDLTITQVSSIVSSIELGGSNPPTAGKYAIEIWTDSSGTHNKKLVRAEQVNGQWERKMNGNLIEQYDLKSYLNDSQSALTEFGSPTPIAVGYIVDQNNGGSSDSSGNSSGTTNGLPVYDLTITQVDTFVGTNVTTAGIYAIEIWTDYTSNTENKKLVSAQQINGDWFRKENSNGDIEQYDLVPAYDSFDEVNSYINSQNLTPTGHIIDEEEEHHGPFNFTIIDEIDLNNHQELIDLSSEHDDIWFQRVNLEDGRYIWALSVENDDENGSTSESTHLMVEMNGSVYEGDFHAYWRDKLEIDVENNSSSNWRENRFDANPEDIKNLLFQFPEIRGPNAPVSPMVKTDPPKSSSENKAIFVGTLITDGNNQNLSLGFQFSEDLRFNDVIEVLSREDNFEAEYDFSKYESKYLYYRAFARNEEFESFGARKRLKIDVLPTTKINGAKIMDGGWESSDWFGHYFTQENGWIYHENLGWCFLVIQKNNHWLWMEKYGWLWTKPSVWPYLYDNENANWLYLVKRKSGPSLFFDRKKEQFLPIHN